MHLTAAELVDLAEGTRAESDAPHLAACARCRAQVAELRSAMSTVADVDVPEPSPLYWTHFSQRVHDAVAAESLAPPRTMVARLTAALGSSRFMTAAAVLASLVIVLFVASRAKAPAPGGVAEPAVAHADLFADAPIDNDPPLALVATLAANLDAANAGAFVADTGLAHLGSADHAVAHMSETELRELHRILQEEMAP
jgi:hypothetical protein